MNKKWVPVVLIVILLLAACGQKGLEEPVTLKNHEGKQVSFPLEEPTVFFFLTTYT